MAKLITPSDRLTGMPLPIYPFSEIPGITPPTAEEEQYLELYAPEDSYEYEGVLGQQEPELSTEPNEWWHHAFHPADQLTSNKKGAKFLRHSRVQYVNPAIHKHYHHMYEGPEFPKSVQDRFKIGVFAVAGYMPKVALSFDLSEKDDPGEIVSLNFNEYKKMTQPDMLRGQFAERKANLRQASKFMMGVILKQEISNIDELTLEEFLLTEDRNRQKKLAEFIFTQLADQSTEPFKDNYQKAYKKKRVIARKKKLTTPRDVVLSVTNHYIPENVTKLHHKILEEKVA